LGQIITEAKTKNKKYQKKEEIGEYMARKTIIMDHNCNNCSRQCRGDIVRDKRGASKSELMCPGWQLPYDMRTSLLERASEHPSLWSALNVILERVDMTFNETTKYPYFTLRLK
jgi:hypothetical protein